VNKTEFIERISEVADGPKSEAQRYFEAVKNVITSALKDGEEVQITGFGKFYVQER
jgi:DNA-binding protein HU-beta